MNIFLSLFHQPVLLKTTTNPPMYREKYPSFVYLKYYQQSYKTCMYLVQRDVLSSSIIVYHHMIQKSSTVNKTWTLTVKLCFDWLSLLLTREIRRENAAKRKIKTNMSVWWKMKEKGSRKLEKRCHEMFIKQLLSALSS